MVGLIACPGCRVHCRVDERVCPHCGVGIRNRDGRVERTAAAILLGLTVAGGAAGAGCSAHKYGAPPAPAPDASPPAVTVSPGDTSSPAPTMSAHDGGMGGAAEPEPVAEYGVAAPPECERIRPHRMALQSAFV